MDPLELFVDFVEDLNRTNVIGHTGIHSPIPNHNDLNHVPSSSTHAVEQAPSTTQPANPINGHMQPSLSLHPSTMTTSSTTHTPLYMNPSSSIARAWANPLNHTTSDMTFEDGFATSYPPYQNNANQRATTTYQSISSYDNMHQNYLYSHTPPWTAYQTSFAYPPPDERYFHHTQHLLSHSGQAVQLAGGPCVTPGFSYDSQCRDSSCQCQFFHQPRSYANGDAAAMVATDEGNAHDAVYEYKLTGRR
ncbi:hypothetical protein T440DRAFT_504210 [Plenodomus tracheiphilus IPT5]|uniref:Uncharacterized protein n=1 Tax=Plenodomus tracheiphilus IPT5 TaxID=1408161 RepID=A0A6A7BN84_9PLEO|nr:hypothetical protein T440DRAFT_504210 [Plenodomus tracheiphilus IPT5]